MGLMIKKITSVIGVLVIGFFVYVSLQPADYSVSREVVINASPESIFPFINSSKKTNDWMPWKDSDPTAQMVYSGPDEGLGSTASWNSQGQLGTGKAEVIESKANTVVKTQLTYTKPMQMSQLAEISLAPTADGTLVRWSVSGKNSFLGRMFCVFVNMDKMVGSQFEKGLATLKGLVEKK